MLVKKLAYLGLLTPLALSACADDGTAPMDDEVGDTAGTEGTDGETGDGDMGTTTGDGDTGTTTGDGDTGTTESGTDTDTGTETDTGTTTGDPGDPLPDAPEGEWMYVEIDGMFCRDGSPAGVGVRYAANSDKLVIYMEGGGACFNALTCLVNPESVGAGKFDPGPFSGIFDNENPDNPLMDYNFIYMPYCTGDVFYGSEPNGNVPGGPQNQMFVGYDNTVTALDRIVDTFPDTTQVVTTGQSGGGFGAASTYDLVASYFPNNDVVLIDDSGPIFRDQYLAPCLQQTFRDVWGVDDSLPADCTACFGADGGGLWNYLTFIHDKYPNAPKGLISSEADGTISTFFGYGQNDCNALFPSFPNFDEALYDLRDNVLTGPEWGTYYKTGNSHTYLADDGSFYGLEVSGTLLVDWVTDLINGDSYHVSP